MQIGFTILFFVLGACFGSFLCCQARRMHLRATKKKSLGPRSICPHCKYQLKWYDNLPIISWLALRGKCRKCHRKIGSAEIISEVLLALGFALLSTTINLTLVQPFDWLYFIIILLLTLTLSFLAIYDGLYGELPSNFLYLATFIGFVALILQEYSLLSERPFEIDLILKPLLSFLILGGLYFILHLVSKGKWIGDGDWLLGTAIALALFNPWLALIALFLANFLASVIMYPSVRKQKTRQIHFGPFLVTAFIITYSSANFFLNMI